MRAACTLAPELRGATAQPPRNVPPGELYCQVRDLTAQDRRSINSEIVVLLREALKKREQANHPA